LSEFKDICFKQFKECLADHCKAFKKNLKPEFERRMPSSMIGFAMLIMRHTTAEER
jgi:hypothetical protein